MSKLYYLTVLLLIILLAIASSWFFESIKDHGDQPEEVVSHDPDYFLENFTATSRNEKGDITYKVVAVHLEHYPDDNSMKLRKPIFSFYDDNIKTWDAVADEAIIFQETQVIHLNGHAILRQLAGSKINFTPSKITAAQLTIEAKKKIAHTKSNITLTQGSNHIQAIGMKADMNKNKIEFLSKTRSHYVIDK